MKGMINLVRIYKAKDIPLKDDETIISADIIGDYDLKVEIESTEHGKFIRCEELHFEQKISTTILIDKCRGFKVVLAYDFNQFLEDAQIDVLKILLDAEVDIIQLLIDNNVNINKLLLDAGVDIETLLISAGIDVNRLLSDAGIEIF